MDESIRHVFVTGGSGFVGRHVVRELLARGYSAACLARDPDKLLAGLGGYDTSRLTTVAGTLFDPQALRQSAAGAQACIHLVGIITQKRLSGQTFGRVHVEGTGAVVKASTAAEVRRFVHMSALGSRPDAMSEYHRTKWAAEEIVRDSGLDWTIFRPSIIHGPDGEFMRMMKFFATSLRMPAMPYFGRGENLVQPVHVKDVATCFVKALSLPEAVGQAYELGGAERYTWKQLYDLCAQAIRGRSKPLVGVPVRLAKLAALFAMPVTPSFVMPYKFDAGQVDMSQEDSVCDTGAVEQAFGLRMRGFRVELNRYADQIR